MGVKDFVMYEPSPESTESSSNHVESQTSPNSEEACARAQAPPVNARFIQHPTRQAVSILSNDGPNGLPVTLSNDLTAADHHEIVNFDTNSTTDVTDELHWRSAHTDNFVSSMRGTVPSGSSLIRRRGHELHLPDAEAQSLLPRSGLPDDNTAMSPPSTADNKHSVLSNSNRAMIHTSHSPIPAIVVFTRGAAPLFLPKLDSYLASFPSPSLPPILPSVDKAKGVVMFPPMDRLAASGRTLEDLETQSDLRPFWRNREAILGGLVNAFLGIMGSSVLASFYSLQGLFNTVQVFALILSTLVPRSGAHIGDRWHQLFLGTIPNILALNFASTLVQSLIFLLAFMTIATGMLYYFHRSTSEYRHHSVWEGIQQGDAKSSSWGLIIVTFLLTVIYLPLSTMALHVIVWSQDLWIVPNPYVNATSYPPNVQPLGPPEEFRDPLDFCWTTTMRRNDVNFAPVFIIVAFVIFLSLTLWFPLRLRQVIKQAMPVVDPYTELGKIRSNSDMDREYQRLLIRDQGAFAFLYKGFRRQWGTFESTYLLAKLSTLFITAVVDPDNCLFRTLSRNRLAIARQVLLLIAMVSFFLIQCFFAPFLDPVNNANEFVSRINYVSTAALSLGVALNVPGKDFLKGPLLYIIYIMTYSFTFYFLIINMSVMHIFVKKFSRRIDFSIDIFSPRLDISPSSPHMRRRIWQEAITALLLTSPECEILKKQRMVFAQAPDSEYPPYLQNFAGSPSERHVENLKIFRDVGPIAYNKAVELVYGSDNEKFKSLASEIQKHFVGPDCYWKNPARQPTLGCVKFFGNAWWIPFPPTLVIRYDDGPLAILQEVSDFETYIAQNCDRDILKRRQIRLALRSLNGQRVAWPYDHMEPVGAKSLWSCGDRRYRAQLLVPYTHGILRTKHKGHMKWQGVQLGSGLDIELIYDRRVRVDGDVIGLQDDYYLTPLLARFLALNQSLISNRVKYLEATIDDYREHYRRECQMKADVLSYRFLSHVYNEPRDPNGLAESSIASERDLRVRQLMVGSEAVFEITYKRLVAVTTTGAATWWFIFWDDLWRRNHNAINGLQVHASDFNPHFPTSIAYNLLPRAALETFLAQRGLFHKVPQWGDFFHNGFLNKLYLRLNEIVFRGSSKAIMLHLGNSTSELNMEEIDLETLAGSSTIGTGGGTDHDDASIRARPAFRWEIILDDPLRKGRQWRRRWFAKFGVWFGITPLWKSRIPSKGVALDVRLDGGRYVAIDE